MTTTNQRVVAQLHQAAEDAQRIANSHSPAPPQTPSSLEETKAQLREEFGPQGWSIVVSDQARWWAFRGPSTLGQPYAVSDIDADSPAELRRRLQRLSNIERPSTSTRTEQE